MAPKPKTDVSRLEVPAADGLIAPERADDRRGPVRDPLLSVSSTGYGTFNALSVEIIGEVCDLIPQFGTKTPAWAQVAPPGEEHLLAILPCKRNAEKKFVMRWSRDREKASMRLLRVLKKVDVALPGPGYVLELPVQPFEHPTLGWCVGVATSGTTRREIKRGSRKARTVAAAPAPVPAPAPATAPATAPAAEPTAQPQA